MLASAMNANLGGRDHMPVYVERQVIEWCRQIFRFPQTAGGLLVSGTSHATLLSLTIARQRACPDLKTAGMSGCGAKLMLYTSAEAHNSVAKAASALGFGKPQLRSIPAGKSGGMDCGKLQQAIVQDRSDGWVPFCVVATAGTVNTGDFDDLDKIAKVAGAHDIWLHVDGAFGGLAILSDTHQHLTKGIERAHSIAFDFHKWLHVPYDAGCLLVRDKRWQLQTFSDRPDYLAEQGGGLAAGSPWFCEMGLELSRGFRALKVWFTLKEQGLTKLGRMITKNCAQAAYLADLVDANPSLELMAPNVLNITCFRYNPGYGNASDLDRLNTEIVIRLQESGIAAPSTTKIGGRLAIRVNITNHRTQTCDMDLLVEAVLDQVTLIQQRKSAA